MAAARSDLIKYGILAGAVGGLAEVAWVLFYAAVTGGDAATLARGVTTAVGATALLPAAPAIMGIAVHMMLAVMLGVTLTGLWQALMQTQRVSSLYVVASALLASVWAINFFVVLPIISPAFVHLLPLSVSLVSKLLFGLAAAETLRRCAIVGEPRPAAAVCVRVINQSRYPAP
jgi:hypothetical protein